MLVEDEYDFVHCSFLVVSQHWYLVDQKSLGLQVVAKVIQKADNQFIILSVVIGTYSFTAGSGRLIKLLGIILSGINESLNGHTTVSFHQSQWNRTGLSFGGTLWDLTRFLFSRSAASIPGPFPARCLHSSTTSLLPYFNLTPTTFGGGVTGESMVLLLWDRGGERILQLVAATDSEMIQSQFAWLQSPELG